MSSGNGHENFIINFSGFTNEQPDVSAFTKTRRVDIPPTELKEIDELLPHAIILQQQFSNAGILTFLGGGLGLDVLAQASLPNHSSRPHKDIDLLVPGTALQSVGHILEDLGYHLEPDSEPFTDDLSPPINLRTFVNKIGVQVDLMGYTTYERGGRTEAELPLMSWGRIDYNRPPIALDLPPVTVATSYGQLAVASPESLLRIKSVQSGYKEAQTHRRDLTVLQQLVAH